MDKKQPKREETKVIHAGPDPDPLYGGVSTPIYQSSTFSFRSGDQGAARFAGEDSGFIYTRLGNPTTRALEQCVAELEGGYDALGTSSGMAAISTALLGCLDRGDHVVGTDAVYGPTRGFAEKHLTRFGIESSWVPTERIESIREAIRPNTRMLFIETPANPTIKLTDLEACGRIAKECGALLVVDNTFSSPVLQKPLRFGADVVLHSMTKYLNGHSDVVAGILIARDQEIHARLQAMLQNLGGTMDPHQAWLVLRGVRSLALRVEKAQENAGRLAAWLVEHPKIAWVSYPGMPSHPQHELMKKQMAGPGAMISFGVRGGYEAAKRTIDEVRLAVLAVSLGGLETLIEHPASMTHTCLPRAEREEAGITDDLVRLSVGCEGFEDLRDDLEQALAKVPEVSGSPTAGGR
ncbi:MAG: aminotransferase class I/II-fold pyridoxal phosphate-dependent enzyme [Candidatus Eisenbacteria bacterium]|nr:aminotransferase class I/II-fold pyridoxal phosphate-dependent enzyme [Candidatus Latescibacterota bacterium]MBD3300889.1 aminotransferase class I/II-fold pyridoxal phosphate-dependent enzyme [Candidatus Eisenbacteria bacterium]